MASRSKRHGNPAARGELLARLLRDRGTQLLRQVRHHCDRIDDAEDALADACVRFLHGYHDSGEDDDALRWLLAVARRRAWEIGRRRRRRDAIAPIVPLEDAAGMPGADTAELVERHEEVDEVMAAIDRLAPDERTALILLGLGYSYAEIGQLRGWSHTKVNRCLSEGRARVRAMLEGGGEFLTPRHLQGMGDEALKIDFNEALAQLQPLLGRKVCAIVNVSDCFSGCVIEGELVCVKTLPPDDAAVQLVIGESGSIVLDPDDVEALLVGDLSSGSGRLDLHLGPGAAIRLEAA